MVIGILVVALAPLMLRPHRRWGLRTVAVLVTGTAAVDVARFAAHVPYIAFLNVALVWLTVHQLGSLDWWLIRPVWIVTLAAVTVLFLVAFRRADRPRPATVSRLNHRWGTAVAATGVALCSVGVLGFSLVGFGGLLAGRQAVLIVAPITPLWSTVLLAAGGALLATSRPRAPARPYTR